MYLAIVPALFVLVYSYSVLSCFALFPSQSHKWNSFLVPWLPFPARLRVPRSTPCLRPLAAVRRCLLFSPGSFSWHTATTTTTTTTMTKTKDVRVAVAVVGCYLFLFDNVLEAIFATLRMHICICVLCGQQCHEKIKLQLLIDAERMYWNEVVARKFSTVTNIR